MKVIIEMDEQGRFSVNKDDQLPIFTAIGMLELAKKVMLEPDKDEVTEDITDLLEEDVDAL